MQVGEIAAFSLARMVGGIHPNRHPDYIHYTIHIKILFVFGFMYIQMQMIYDVSLKLFFFLLLQNTIKTDFESN